MHSRVLWGYPVRASKNCFPALAIKKVSVHQSMDDAEGGGKDSDADAEGGAEVHKNDDNSDCYNDD